MWPPPQEVLVVPFWQRLYVRLWLAVVLLVAVLTLLAGWAWRSNIEPPLREMVVRNQNGEVVGHGVVRPPRPAERLGERAPDAEGGPPGQRRGPEFALYMNDGDTYFVQLPRQRREPQPTWARWPFGFAGTLALVGLAVALATYPILRRLTQRLERLRHSVERWGSGDLGVRAPLHGNDEVGSLAQRFNQAAEHIEALMASQQRLSENQRTLLQAQKSLLANASHELRSPLARIRMGVELLGGSAAPHWREELTRNIAELDQLIDEILLASRLDAAEADMGTVEAVDLMGLLAEECAGFDLEPDIAPNATGGVAVRGVSRLLRRLIRNLLENARRYGAGEIKVGLQLDAARAVLSVCDRGPGVSPDQRERIFEPFYRLPGASEREGGVGLGLALVKSIAKRHNGNVRCTDHMGGGACFVVELPLEG